MSLLKTNKTVDGELVERLNTPVLKTGSPSRGSRVRIPRSPPFAKMAHKKIEKRPIVVAFLFSNTPQLQFK